MNTAGHFLVGLAALVIGLGLAIWFCWQTIKKAEDAGRMVFKWVITGIVFAILIFMALGLNRSGPGGAFVVPIAGAIFGVFLGILWAPHLGALLAKPFTSFYDGGGQEVEARPFYAIARARQKRGNYPEAIAEIRKQLQRFPEDYEGWMLLAEIYANDLKDKDGAQECIREILGHAGHTPKNIAYALNRAADWHLALASDREAARLCLTEVITRFPETELAHSAAQRIAHLTSDRMLAEQKERPRIKVTHYDEYIGLRGAVADPRPPEEDHATAAARHVNRLRDHPDDVEAREELARIYADHYQRMDLAADQIEQLVSAPGAGQKEITRWLNMLADFHVRVDQDKNAARDALNRIIGLYPKSAVAAQAETRMAYLDTEMLKNKKSQALKLGSSQKDLGLNPDTSNPED